MVLEKVKRTQSGTIPVSNLEGDAESNPRNVQIMYVFQDCSHAQLFHYSKFIISDSPRCEIENRSTVGANIGSNLSVLCHVDSFPEPSSFTWSFNNGEESYKVSIDKSMVNRTASIVRHSLLSDNNFDTFTALQEIPRV